MKKNIWIYDLEIFSNFFSGTFKNVETKEIKSFYIFHNHNNLSELIKFLKNEVSGLIGFNNLNFDYPILDFILRNYKDLEITTYKIFKKTQNILNSEWSSIPDHLTLIPQLDLYKIWHFDNKAKRTSLKTIEIAINFNNVEDLPFSFNYKVKKEDIENILSYNLNDVEATYEFYKLSLDKIKLRKELSKKYGINLTNANDGKIGTEIFAKLLAEKKGISVKKLKEMRTYRSSINLGDVVFPYIKFKTKEFNKVLNNFKSKTLTTLKKSLEYSLIYKRIKYNYGVGGLHAFGNPGIYESNENEVIISCDVSSMYPNISINNKFYPQHLGYDYCEIYENIYNQRKVIPKSDPNNKALKNALNIPYGKSNEAFSFFYDSLYTVKTTVNGQLLLSMLAESLQLEGFKMLMINTDGMECIVPRDRVDEYYKICYDWESITNLELEFDEYQKLVLRDVNNYAGLFTNGKIKYKGAFEIDKEIHKDHSQRIVRIALSEYYFKNIKPEKTIKNHLLGKDYKTHNFEEPIKNNTIFDFCKKYKATKGWQTEYHYIKGINKQIDKLSKNVRYYLSTTGGALLKKHTDNRIISIESNKTVTLFNKYIKKDNYNIDYSYYINETYKIINSIDNGQLKLF